MRVYAGEVVLALEHLHKVGENLATCLLPWAWGLGLMRGLETRQPQHSLGASGGGAEMGPLPQASGKEGLSVASSPRIPSKGLFSPQGTWGCLLGPRSPNFLKWHLMCWFSKPCGNGAPRTGFLLPGTLRRAPPPPRGPPSLLLRLKWPFLSNGSVSPHAHSCTVDRCPGGPLLRSDPVQGHKLRDLGMRGEESSVPPLLLPAGHHLPRPEAGERAARLRGPHRPHGLRA